MNILHVINSIAVGGAETFLLRLIQNQESKGNTCFVLIVFPNGNEIDYFDYWKKTSNVTFFYPYKEPVNLKMRALYQLNKLMKMLTRKEFLPQFLKKSKAAYYKRIITKNKIDIINSHLLSADFFTYANFVPHVKTPWVLTSQGCYNDYDQVDLVREIIPHIKGMTYVADKNLKIFNQAGLPLTENKRLIYNALPKYNSSNGGIDKSTYGLTDNDFVVGLISRSIPEKGMEIAIKAVRKLNDEGYTTIKLILCGPENAYYNTLKNNFQSENILFLGVVRDPLPYIQLFDVGILPSYFPSESCPSTIAEYLTCSKPVISTNAGEIPNMISVGSAKAGIIIEKNDRDGLPDYRAFADAILLYLSDNERLEYDSKKAAIAAEKFDIEIAANEYDLIYKEAKNNVRE